MNNKTFKGSNDFEHLIKLINSVPLLIGIDGCGGSGKSTLASKLKSKLLNTTVVHMDDFYLPSSQLLKTFPKNKPVGADYELEACFKSGS